APVVARLLAAGFIPIGRTNMTEFAFSGLGINPHHGTPRSPWDRETGRVPGGSSSGAAVSVADGMALVAIGTDTGGSCRIPAAYCGVVGYKPTARRVPIGGVLPLAPSLDSIGPLARSVACCAIVDAVLAGTPPAPPKATSLASLRLAVPETIVLDGLAPEVATAFDRALRALSESGAAIIRTRFPVFEEVGRVGSTGGFAASEAYAWHRALMAEKGALYDPRIRQRIARGEHINATDYIDLRAARARLIARFDAATAGFDAVVMPTSPILPAPIAALDDEREYNRINLLSLRNTTLGNFLDRCAISLPCHRQGEPPVGLMLMGETMGDARLFSIAQAVGAAIVP
ncbi:MAG: amidase, partial [Acetobacteraceae bacterium]